MVGQGSHLPNVKAAIRPDLILPSSKNRMPEVKPTGPLGAKLDALFFHLRALQPLFIAVSGGVDSRLLLHLAQVWNLEHVAAYAVGPHQSPGEQAENAARLARAATTPSLILRFNPLDLPEVGVNARNRCYWCKKALFFRFLEWADQHNCHVVDGTQADDLTGHRPGRIALRELGVHSPLAHAGLTKADVRQAGALFGLEDPHQPSRPCLLTRFPYDHALSPAKLAAVGRLEDGLAQMGLRQFRFRVVGNDANLLQLHPDELPCWSCGQKKGEELVHAAGLDPFTVDVTPRLSGFYDTPGPEA